ncbi:transmembrane protein, putative (macronuclear) [Tetrahymena thermophila SB210]|uniref:Transmembrane protein, putative n=1 Tax=Tetrahymena thermophila (strain SB210) TaxID=312017 RepID=Q22CZ6_TETTS|nr:transmembrane protein, putative [Tetrahymena thermophila SB210]EAR83123.1 transmembrane protein, putative [Tetrahymena thermophila SB210]|eukprot:XP_001030786.1 transmembrane protein, putative [Tetrahymena thermophila SB210]
MKLFEQCLKNSCEQLRFRYEQTQKLFQRTYIDYTQCTLQKLNALGSFTNENDNQNSNIIGGGDIPNSSKKDPSQQYLNDMSKQIIQIYESCYLEQGKNLVELDSYKDCQINCLQQAIDLTQKQQSSSNLSTNLILAIIFSLIGFVIIIFITNRCYKLIKRSRDHTLLQEFEDQNQKYAVDGEDPDVLVQKQHNNHAKLFVTSNSKYSYKKRLNGALQRLDVNKVKQIISHLKQQNPDVSFDDKADHQFSPQQSEVFQVKNSIHSCINQNSIESSNFIRQFTKNNAKSIRTENNHISSENQSTNINNSNSCMQQHQTNIRSIPSNSTYDKSLSNLYKYEISSFPSQPCTSPQFQSLEKQYNLTRIDEDTQQQQENQQQNESGANDRTHQFQCYKPQGSCLTSPCEPLDKQDRSIPPLSLSQRNIEDNTNQKSPDQKKNNYKASCYSQIQISPIILDNLQTQEFAEPSPQYLKGKSNKSIKQFKLEKDTPPASLQDICQKQTQSNESSSEEADCTIQLKQKNSYQNPHNNQVKFNNCMRSKSLYEEQEAKFNQNYQNETVV